jgi:hypothetical protein
MENNKHTNDGPLRLREFMQTWGPRTLFESLLIVFSVVLALSINNWISSVQMAARVREARSYFIQELKANRDSLSSNEFLAHHEQLRADLDKVDTTSPVSSDQARAAVAPIYKTGIHVARLRDIVWRTYSGSEVIEHLPPPEAFALNDAYLAQQQLDALQTSYYPVLSALPQQLATQQDSRGSIAGLQLYLSDLIGAEKITIDRYETALKILGASSTLSHDDR